VRVRQRAAAAKSRFPAVDNPARRQRPAVHVPLAVADLSRAGAGVGPVEGRARGREAGPRRCSSASRLRVFNASIWVDAASLPQTLSIFVDVTSLLEHIQACQRAGGRGGRTRPECMKRGTPRAVSVCASLHCPSAAAGAGRRTRGVSPRAAASTLDAAAAARRVTKATHKARAARPETARARLEHARRGAPPASGVARCIVAPRTWPRSGRAVGGAAGAAAGAVRERGAARARTGLARRWEQ